MPLHAHLEQEIQLALAQQGGAFRTQGGPGLRQRMDFLNRTPLYTIEENYIDLHTDEEFVVPEVTIKYIRRPDSISITNGVGCELPEHTHNEIVEMTIKSILEGIQDPRYQTQTMETFESE